MDSLNHSLLEGNLVKDPNTRNTPDGTLICNFSIASNRYYKNKQSGETERETSYFDIEAWGKLAETAKAIAHKGRFCRVTGRMKQERWEGKDGSPRSKVIVVANKIEYRPEGGEGARE